VLIPPLLHSDDFLCPRRFYGKDMWRLCWWLGTPPPPQKKKNFMCIKYTTGHWTMSNIILVGTHLTNTEMWLTTSSLYHWSKPTNKQKYFFPPWQRIVTRLHPSGNVSTHIPMTNSVHLWHVDTVTSWRLWDNISVILWNTSITHSILTFPTKKWSAPVVSV
jgi:hypothetical protein